MSASVNYFHWNCETEMKWLGGVQIKLESWSLLWDFSLLYQNNSDTDCPFLAFGDPFSLLMRAVTTWLAQERPGPYIHALDSSNYEFQSRFWCVGSKSIGHYHLRSTKNYWLFKESFKIHQHLYPWLHQFHRGRCWKLHLCRSFCMPDCLWIFFPPINLWLLKNLNTSKHFPG